MASRRQDGKCNDFVGQCARVEIDREQRENEGDGDGGHGGGGDIYLAVSNRAIKLSHCGSSVGRGLVRRSRGQAYQERDATTVSSAERAKERNIERGWLG